MCIGGPRALYGGRLRRDYGFDTKPYTTVQYGNGSYKNFIKSTSRRINKSALYRKTIKNKQFRDLAWTMYKREIAPIVKKKVANAIGIELTEALEKDAKLIAKKGVKKYVDEDAMPVIRDTLDYLRCEAVDAAGRAVEGFHPPPTPEQEGAGKRGVRAMKQSMRSNGFAPTRTRRRAVRN